MLKIGDLVKVKDATMYQGEKKEFIPIGTICQVVGICEENVIGIVPENSLPYNGSGEYWYLESELEKGHMEWVKEEKETCVNCEVEYIDYCDL